jgi:hypothetical protein
MALASRSARRSDAGRKWLLIGVVITLLVLLIDAALQSRSPGPGQELKAGAWIDRVLPIVTTSTAEGQQIAGIWRNGLQTPPSSLSAQLDQIAAGSAHAYQQVISLHPPSNVAGAAGLLEASLLTRSQAANTLRTALQPVLQGGAGAPATTATTSGPDPVLTAIQTAGDDMQIGDRAYQLFVHSLPKLGVTMPASVWAADPSPYQTAKAQLFLTSLHNAMQATPVHQLKIYSVTLTPAPVSLQGETQILPNSSTMAVTVVVADVGNQAEKNLTVTAAIASGGASSSVRDFVDLSAGQAHTIPQMGPLSPPQGVPVSMTVTVTPGYGSEASPVTETLTFMMPGARSTPTTTAPSSTTSSRG